MGLLFVVSGCAANYGTKEFPGSGANRQAAEVATLHFYIHPPPMLYTRVCRYNSGPCVDELELAKDDTEYGWIKLVPGGYEIHWRYSTTRVCGGRVPGWVCFSVDAGHEYRLRAESRPVNEDASFVAKYVLFCECLKRWRLWVENSTTGEPVDELKRGIWNP